MFQVFSYDGFQVSKRDRKEEGMQVEVITIWETFAYLDLHIL